MLKLVINLGNVIVTWTLGFTIIQQNYVPPSPLAPPMITHKGESKHKFIATKYKCLQIKGATNKWFHGDNIIIYKYIIS